MFPVQLPGPPPKTHMILLYNKQKICFKKNFYEKGRNIILIQLEILDRIQKRKKTLMENQVEAEQSRKFSRRGHQC